VTQPMPIQAFIEMTLANDEASTDAELVEFFQAELGLSEAAALAWLARRDEYLREV
jgi:hypothetical protein